MNSRKLVKMTIKGENPGRTPVYGWVVENLKDQISQAFGSVENFEDHYEFDMAHLFGGPPAYDKTKIENMKSRGIEVTPEVLLDIPMLPVNNIENYAGIIKGIEHHQKQRNRFCYLQTNGIFECLNDVFGIEDHLCNLLLYPDELQEVYKKLAQWNKQFAENAMDLGIDMIHVSDDWGAQNSLMFSKATWEEMIYPYHKVTCDAVKERGCFLSLHSDGNVNEVLPGIVELGYDVIHPWQESAGMSYETYLSQYQDYFGILGGLCIQTTLGFNDFENLEKEIRRVFSLLKGKRWMFCTTHFVQDHCSIEELVFAYDLAVKLARE